MFTTYTCLQVIHVYNLFMFTTYTCLQPIHFTLKRVKKAAQRTCLALGLGSKHLFYSVQCDIVRQ